MLPDQSKLLKNIHALIEPIDGKIGVSVSDLENSWQIEINADMRFPMASTCKIAIATYCLSLIEQGKLQADSLIPIYPPNVRTGSGIINHRLTTPGVILSIENLIRLMIEVSDNTATDLLLKMIGGPLAVTRFLKNNHINAMRLDRSFLQVVSQQMDIAHLVKDDQCTPEQFIAWENSICPDKQKQSKLRFLLDDQDTTTPQAARNLLEKILKKEIVNSFSSQFILDSMGECRTGLARIRAGIPQSVWVGQKTGTMTGVTNDIAVIKLPEKDITLTMAIYMKQSKLALQEQENIIANIARVVFEAL